MPAGLRAGVAFVELEPRVAHGFENAVAGQIEGPLGRVGGRLSSVGSTLSRSVTVPLLAGLGLAGAGIMAAGVQIDDALDSIATRTGATGERLESLQGSFRNVAATVPDDLGRVADAVGMVAQRTDLTGAPLEAMTQRLLTLSRITGQDLETTITNSTRLFGDWSVATADQADTLDELYRATTATGIPLDRLQGLLVTFGGPLRQLGFGLEESAAMLGNFEREGVNTELVVGAMRQSLGRMARAGEEPIETFRRVTEEIKNAGSAGEANGIALELFGARAGPDMAAAIREGRFEIGDLWQEVARGEGTIMGAAESTDGFAETFGRLRNSVILAVEPIATRLFAALDDFVPRLVPVIEWIGRAIEWLLDLDPTIQIVIAAIVGLVAAAGPVLSVLGAIVPVIGALISPVGLVVAAVAALVAGLIYAYTHFEGFRNVVDGVVQWLTGTVVPAVVAFVGFLVAAFSDAIGWVRENWPAISEAIGHVLAVVQGAIDAFVAVVTTAWHLFGDEILSIASAVWDQIRNVIETVIGIVRSIIEIALGLINGDWSQVWNGIKDLIGTVWNYIKETIGNALDVVKAILRAALDGLSAAWSAAWDGIKSGLSSVWDGIKSTVSGGIDAVVGFVTGLPGRIASAVGSAFSAIPNAFRSAINALIDLWNNFEITFGGYDIPGPGPNIPSFTISTPNIPHLAMGGTFSGLAVVGERGPELLSSSSVNRVHSNGDLAAMLAAAVDEIFEGTYGAGSSAPAVVIENATFEDEVDLDLLFRRASFAALEGSFG